MSHEKSVRRVLAALGARDPRLRELVEGLGDLALWLGGKLDAVSEGPVEEWLVVAREFRQVLRELVAVEARLGAGESGGLRELVQQVVQEGG